MWQNLKFIYVKIFIACFVMVIMNAKCDMSFSVSVHIYKTKCLSVNITTLHINAPVVFIPGEDFYKTLQMALENKNKETETYINPETYAK